MNKLILTLVLVSYSVSALAYPVMFKCDKNGILSDVETSEDIFTALKDFNTLSPEDIETYANEYCKGSEECIARLKQAGILSKMSGDIVMKLFKDELESLDKTVPSTQVPETSVELLKKLKYMKELLACRKTQQKIASPDAQNMQFSYPFFSNYMFGTGCTQLSASGYCANYGKEEVKEVVRRSILAGVDPYLFLALALQENGLTGSPTGLYLDPIGIVKAIGCEGKSTKESDEAFNSYGTFYKVSTGVVKRNDFAQYLEKYYKDDTSFKKKKSYLCNDVKDADDIDVHAKPQGNKCCLEMPLELDSESAKSHLVPFYIKDMVAKDIPLKQKDPAFTVQLYNGFSNLMGGAEPVPMFRAGANFFKDPSYGYQGMDFIINALLLNKDLRDMVDEQKKELKKEFPSILCKGKPEGFHSIDSDYYFNKHKDSGRLEILYDKFKAGKGYNDLTSREKRVFDSEVNTQTVSEKLGYQGVFNLGTLERLENFFYSTDGASLGPKLYHPEHVSKKEFKTALAVYKLSSSEIDVLYDYAKLFTSSAEDRDTSESDTLSKITEIDDKIIETFFKKKFAAKKDVDSITKPTIPEIKRYLKELTLEVDPKDEPNLEAKWAEVYGYIKDYASEPFFKQHKKTLSSFKDYPGIQAAAKDAIYKQKSLEEISNSKYVTDGNRQEFLEKAKAYFAQIDAARQNKVISGKAVFGKYFKEVYKDRATIQKASNYPWRRFTDEEVTTLRDKIYGTPPVKEDTP